MERAGGEVSGQDDVAFDDGGHGLLLKKSRRDIRPPKIGNAGGDRDGQTAKLWRGEAPPAPDVEREQSRYLNNRGELTSTDTMPRTADATVQIARVGSGLSIRSRIYS
jgi:hypothetical protein